MSDRAHDRYQNQTDLALAHSFRSMSRWTSSYNATYANPHGEDPSYQQAYLHKHLIVGRFKAMRAAFTQLNSNGVVSSEEMNILTSMYKLDSGKAREISAGMEKKDGKFNYTDYIHKLRKAKYNYLESLPESIIKTIPPSVIDAANSQETLISVTGDRRSRFLNINMALLAHDTEGTGLLRKDLLLFMLKLFGLDTGSICYTFSRFDHNENKLIAYVPFLDSLKENQSPDDDLGATVGPCPRSPFKRSLKKSMKQ